MSTTLRLALAKDRQRELLRESEHRRTARLVQRRRGPRVPTRHR